MGNAEKSHVMQSKSVEANTLESWGIFIPWILK